MRADDFLDGAEPTADEFLDGAKGLPKSKKQPALSERLYGTLNKLFQPGARSVMDDIAPEVKLPPYDPVATAGVDRIINQSQALPLLDAKSTVGVIEKGVRGGVSQLAKSGLGLTQGVADLVGADAVGDIAARAIKRADDFAGNPLESGKIEGFAPGSIVQDLPKASAGALTSIIANAPALAAGVMAPGTGLPLMFGQVASSEYGEGRAAGLNPIGALLRSLPMAGAEVAGEKLGGFNPITQGLRRAIDEGSLVPLGRAMLASSAREVPSEMATTGMQFGIDKLPGVGTNQDATLDDLGSQLKDTALQTIIQAGGMGGIGAAITGNSKNQASSANILPDSAPATDIESLTRAIQETASIDSKNSAPRSADAFLDEIDLPPAPPLGEGEPVTIPPTEQGLMPAVEQVVTPVLPGPVSEAAPTDVGAEAPPSVAQPQVANPAGTVVPEMAAEVERSLPEPVMLTENGMQIEEAREGLRPGDIVAASGDPFRTRAQASSEAKAAGKNWLVKKGAGGFVVRYQQPTEKQIAANQRRTREANSVNTERDSLFAAIAKLGGIRLDDLTKQWGFDPAEFKSLRGAGIKRVGTRNGMPLDRAGEALAELGYLSYDQNGKHDLAELFDLFDGELRGSKHYTPQGFANVGQEMLEQEWLSQQDAAALDNLPEEGREIAEEMIDEYDAIEITAEDEAGISERIAQADAVGISGQEAGSIIDDARPEEGNDGSAAQADSGTSTSPGADERASDGGTDAVGLRSESLEQDSDIPFDAADSRVEQDDNQPLQGAEDKAKRERLAIQRRYEQDADPFERDRDLKKVREELDAARVKHLKAPFSRRRPQSGMRIEDVRAAIAADTFNYDVEVIATIADAPAYIREQAESEKGGKVEGYWDITKNKVALIAENLGNPERARQVARHELIGHYGLENMLYQEAGPNEMNRLVRRVLQAEKDGNKIIVDLAKQVDQSQPGLDDARRAREIIAVMAERNIQNSITKRVIDAIREFLKKIGFINGDITDSEIATLLRETQEYLRSQGREMFAGQPAAAFARVQDTALESGKPLTRDDVLAKQEREERAEKNVMALDKPAERNVTADQVDMFNEQSSLFSRAGPVDTQAFKRWFGDSKVVDAEGKPMVVYHGTNTILPIGEFGGRDFAGWFAKDVDFVNRYLDEPAQFSQPHVIPAYLKIDNPLRLEIDMNADAKATIAEFQRIGFSDDLGEYGRGGIAYRYIASERFAQQLRAAGYDGLIVREDGHETYGVLDPSQIKSATGNNGDFDSSNPDIRFSRKPIDDGEKPNTNKPTAGDIFRTERDAAGRRRSVAGQKMFDAMTEAIRPALEKVKLSNDAPPAFKQMMRQFHVDQQTALVNAKRVAEEGIANLTPEERVMISTIVENNANIGDLPPDAISKIAAEISGALKLQAQELVDLGMATEERLIANYLPRAYRNPILARATSAPMLVSWYQKSKLKMQGNRLKSRGMVDIVQMKDIGNYLKLGWKPSAMTDGEVIPHDLMEIINGRNDAMTPGFKKYPRDLKIVMWRDYTLEERRKMGEIQDGILRYALGYSETQRDIAIGRLFKSIAEHDDLSSAINPGGWAKIPDQKIPGTELKRYGALSGLYVPKYVHDMIERSTQPKGPLMAMYDKALSFWKEGKTVWNPVAHGNNVVSNVFTMHFAGLNPADPRHWRRTIQEYRGKGAYYQEAIENGLFGTEFASRDIQELFLPELTDELDIETVAASRFNKAAEALKKAGKPIGWYRDRMQKAYEFEDQFFKLMLYIDRRRNGADIEAAITDTERYIFNYADIPEGVEKIKRAYSPFFSYTYKALPMLVHTAMTRPDRLLVPIALLGGANWMAYALMGGDEEEERKGMPDYMAGRTAIGTHKAIRMPFNVGDRPAFMDISRRVPLGDLFDLHNQTGGLSAPAPFMPSHPLFTTALAIGFNMDSFTGKDVVKGSDTSWEAAEKRADWLWKQMTPNAPFVPGSWNWNKLMNGTANAFDTEMAGYTGYTKAGDPMPLSLALLDVAGGTKIRSFDPARGIDFKGYAFDKERKEIQSNIRSALRNKAMSDTSRKEYVDQQRDKLKEVNRKKAELR